MGHFVTSKKLEQMPDCQDLLKYPPIFTVCETQVQRPRLMVCDPFGAKLDEYFKYSKPAPHHLTLATWAPPFPGGVWRDALQVQDGFCTLGWEGQERASASSSLLTAASAVSNLP